MKNILILFFILLSTQISFAVNSTAPYKKALLIENYGYEGYKALPDNSNNITELARYLTYMGFEVDVETNLKKGQLASQIKDFYQNLPPQSITFLYFGGYIFTDTNQESILMPLGSDIEMLSPNYISIQKISELAIENNVTETNQNFLIFDAFFEARSSSLNYQKSINQSLTSKDMTISAYDAKDNNLIGEPSGFIPSLIFELSDYQPVTEAFSELDKNTKSISRANTFQYTGEIFSEEQLTSAVHSEVAAIKAIMAMDMPTFPFPPPKASASYTFDKELFSGIDNLTQSSERIEKALKKSGYYEKSYYQIPNGYALVTRIEKMEPDGTPSAEAERWNINDSGSSSSFDLLSYFKSLFIAEAGHYRIIVFLVTSDNVQMTEKIMLMSEGKDFLSSGLNRLPPEFDYLPFTENHYCTALIYEWYKIEHEEAVFMEPSKFLGQYHLAKNKFVEYLEAEK